MIHLASQFGASLLAQQANTYYQLTRVRLMSEAWHWLLLLVICALVAGYIYFVYRRDSVELRRGVSIALLMLRLSAFAGLLFFFLNLERLTERTLTRPSRVLLLADTSLSMGLRDSDLNVRASASRIDEVIDELGEGQLVHRLRENHDVIVYRFDQANRPLELASYARYPQAGESEGDQVTASAYQSQVEGARQVALLAGMLWLVSIATLGWTFISGRQRDPTAEHSSWAVLVATVCLIAGVVVLATANLRYPAVDLWTTVGLRAAQPPSENEAANTGVVAADPVVNWSAELLPRGSKTRLGDAVQFLIDKERGGPIAGIVVFTDGRNNAGNDVATVLRAARDSGIPIYPVGLGSDRQIQNVRVVDIEAPPRVFPGDDFTITGFLQAHGLAGSSISVELISRAPGSEDGSPTEKVEEQRRVDLGAEGQTQAIEFQLTPESEGDQEFVIRARVPAEDSNQRDNQKAATVEIVQRRTKILLLAGGPTREYRFLRNLLFRDREIEVHVMLQTGDVGISQESDEVLLEFPTLPDEMFEYDCMVAFDPDWQALDAIQVDLLDRWVAEKAGGLVVVAGPVFTPEWSRVRRGRDSRVDTIKGLYPVVFFSQGGATLSHGRFGGESAWPINFSREGLNSEFLWLADDQIASEQQWSAFEGVYGFYKAKDPKPGAKVYARFSDPQTAVDSELPIYMAGHFYGAGRVFFQASGEMWRLRSLDETLFEQYYTKLLRWVSQGRLLRDSSRGVLLLDKDRCLLGDPVTVQAILTDAQHQPLLEQEVTANLVLPDGQRKDLLLQQVLDGGREGMYSAQFMALIEGDYRIELGVPGGGPEDMLSRELRVKIPSLEIEDPRRNDSLLTEIAQLSNGRYFVGMASARGVEQPGQGGLPELVSIQDQQTTLPGTPDIDFDQQLMKWLMALIAGALCLEWLFRRLSRLA